MQTVYRVTFGIGVLNFDMHFTSQKLADDTVAFIESKIKERHVNSFGAISQPDKEELHVECEIINVHDDQQAIIDLLPSFGLSDFNLKTKCQHLN